MSPERLFVYGTLRRGSNHPLAKRLEEAAEYLGSASIQGELREIDAYPGLVAGTDSVMGDLWQLKDSNFLRELDAYEECGPGFPEPWEYFRDDAGISTDNGQATRAWVYFYNRDYEGKAVVEGGDWLKWKKP